MGGNEYYRSKMPLKLVFTALAAVAVNLLLVFGFQLLLQFHYNSPVDAAALARMDDRYAACTIVDEMHVDSSLSNRSSTAYLLEDPQGQQYLAFVERHALVDRYRYLEKVSGEVPQEEGLQEVRIGSTLAYSVSYIENNRSIPTFSVTQYLNGRDGLFLTLCAMCAVELVVYCLLFKRHELL